MAADLDAVLIDTSAWIDAFQEKTAWVARRIQTLLEEDRAATCGPVLFEIRRGLKPGERKKVIPLFDALHRLHFKETDWSEAGELDATLRQQGHTLPAMDVLIAHICLENRVSILTLDDHFKLVPGLNIL